MSDHSTTANASGIIRKQFGTHIANCLRGSDDFAHGVEVGASAPLQRNSANMRGRCTWSISIQQFGKNAARTGQLPVFPLSA